MDDLTQPFVARVADKLIAQLKEGRAPWQKPWKAGEPGVYFPTNASTGKRYKGINALHLMSQGRNDQRWMTYKQAADVGSQVRKGEKGTPIQYWKFSEERVQRDSEDRPVLGLDGQAVKQTVRLERPALFCATVFNAEQIDGLAPAAKRAPPEWSSVERAESILRASGAVMRHGERDRAFYRPTTDSIHLPDKAQFPSADGYYATAMHELGHWTGHASRLARDMIHPFGSAGYAKEELRAEIFSMIIGDELGLGHDPKHHVAYVGAWIQALRDDPLEIFRAASDAEKIQDFVLGLEQDHIKELAMEQRQNDVRAEVLAELRDMHQLAQAGRSPQDAWDTIRKVANEHQLTARIDRGAGGTDAAFVITFEDADGGHSPVSTQLGHDGKAVTSVAGRRVAGTGMTSDPDWQRDALVTAFRSVAPADAIPMVNGSEQTSWEESRRYDEAWTLSAVRSRSLHRHLDDARSHEVERVRDTVADMTPLNTQNLFWQRHHLPLEVPGEFERLDAVIEVAWEIVDARSQDARVAEARLAMGGGKRQTGDTSTAFQRASENALGFALPIDWNGGIEMVAHYREVDGAFGRADGTGDPTSRQPDAWCLYAHRGDRHHRLLARFETREEAERMAARLAVIDAHSAPEEHDRVSKLARLRERRPPGDPSRADESRALAGDVAKDALTGVVSGADGNASDVPEVPPLAPDGVEMAPGSAMAAQPASLRKYLDVPFKMKDEVKALGGKWDRAEQAWYIPDGVAMETFARFTRAPAPIDSDAPRADGRTQSAHERGSAREFLAVPYGERKKARAAGALWDKAAKSWYVGPDGDAAKLAVWRVKDDPAPQSPAMRPKEEFGEALRALGCVVEGEHPVMDGKKHRIAVAGEKRGARSGSGFYVAHMDGYPAGYIKNNKTGEECTWRAKGYRLDRDQRQRLQAEMAARLAERSANLTLLQDRAAARVVRQMENLSPVVAPTPYMIAKGIDVHPGVFTDRGGKTTYLPLYDVDDKQRSMQYISEDGTKRFAKDSGKSGCFHVVGGLPALEAAPALVIAEGYATACTLARDLGFAAVCALDSGNLPLVAKLLHQRYPDKPVIVAGDDDHQLEATLHVNPGRVKAEEAAKLTGGVALLPIFAPGEQVANPRGFTDFNDLACKSSLGRDGLVRQMRASIESALAAKSPPVHQPALRGVQKNDARPRLGI